jgi:3-phytase
MGIARPVLSTSPTLDLAGRAWDEETGEAAGDADDPAIWIDRDRPERSLVIGSDKKSGLYVWSMRGELLQHLSLGTRANNVDVRQDVDLGDGRPVDVVAANLRTAGKLALFLVDREYEAARGPLLELAGRTSRGNEIQRDSYGFALYRRPSDRALFVFERGKEPTIANPEPEIFQYRIRGSTTAIELERVRTLGYGGGTAEGFVADDAAGFLYVSEESAGIHQFLADPAADAGALRLFAQSDGIRGDREGLAIYGCEDGSGYLLLSSQGNSTFKLYDRRSLELVATIAPVDAAGEPVVLNTDGIEATSAAAGDPAVHLFSRGMLVAQDDYQKRFHLYDFAQIAASAELELCAP